MKPVLCREEYEESLEYVSELTKLMDKHLIPVLRSTRLNTYLWDAKRELETQEDKKEKIILFRFPGSTVGSIILDENNIIKDIIFNDSSYNGKDRFYNKNVVEDVKMYIGRELKVMPILDIILNDDDELEIEINDNKIKGKVLYCPDTEEKYTIASSATEYNPCDLCSIRKLLRPERTCKCLDIKGTDIDKDKVFWFNKYLD